MAHLTYNTRLVFSSEGEKHAVVEVLKSQRFAFNIRNTSADVLVVENLKGLTTGKRGKKATKQVPFSRTIEILKHKAAIFHATHGKSKTVIAVNPRFTSQVDSQTGKREGERQGRRFLSKNGRILDADVDAAVNIAKRSKLPVLYSYDASGDVKILEGQAEVIRPIVFKPSGQSLL